MNPIVLAIPVFMLTIVLEAWVAQRRGRAVYDTADALTSLHLGVVSQVIGVLVKLVMLGTYTAVYQHWRFTTLPTDNLWVWLGALVAYDFCYYWAHRMGHEVSVLWAAHEVHHSSEYYNLSTALRQTSSGWLLGWVFYLPMALAGVPPLVMALVAMIDLLYQYWVHTELVGRLGWLDRVFVTPSNHRVHHGQNDYCIDRNYGGIFILFDRLFGTFAEERDDEAIRYGVRTPLRSLNPAWANLHYYVALWQASGQVQGWRKKLQVWFGAPGAWTGQPLGHFDPASFQYYRPATPAGAQLYAMFQFALLVPCISHFLALAPTLDTAPLLAYAAFIIASTLSLAALLEGRPWSGRIEQLRATGAALAFALLSDWFGYSAPLIIKLATLIAVVIAVSCLEKIIKTTQWRPT